ncbi:CaiB/BaiF CoA-transferase family protein [Phenylobacterium sp.]|uniref:CaiB/BaiF CoA transferase family protein n=1 Tax=Phenylobacterium sp. TaxID=1871053 RepID=UPI0025D1196A|nr:CaiB/BaiF CoA-transferase family protein [Phenylobacterium sp.]MCA6287559.1 CoA transferase [Phenylobacterium sp.]MCA6309828.1 CoA transferase [Phenylobacterium sp.]MCA6322689.1 CoA transferase [Phenylobacterium sp.]MCA6336062.1 CoA transferase [Phenylobacterium sp.]MCA6338807.1 CoA transferase [Phenylobacterium sp.]
MRQGPLTGLKIIEFAGIGPGPFCGMLLSDLGADVVRIDRKGQGRGSPADITARGRRSVGLDLKNPASIETCLKLFETADVVFEGFRPGVMERLGLGPDVALKRNPKLVYGRMTGWGQFGPYAQAAGHDMNYIAITGALHAIGTEDKPIPPLNLVGDFGGGALYLAFGILAGVIKARETGEGQVIDCAMSDGAASLMAMFYGFKASGAWTENRRSNLLDGGAHFYDTYQCSDGKWVSIGSIEPQFYALLLEKTGISDPAFKAQMDRGAWPDLKAKLAAVIATKTQSEWCDLMEATDVCFAPVLDLDEAPKHAHNVARQTFVELAGVTQPAPAPRFSKTPGAIQGPPPAIGAHDQEALRDWGFSEADVSALKANGALNG